jgi:hypothetical protein
MKRIIFIGVLLAFSFFGKGQIYQPSISTVYGSHNLRLKADSVQHVPEYADSLFHSTDHSAQIRVINGVLYFYSAYLNKWVASNNNGSGSSNDTASLSNRINKKLDTVYKINDSTIGISKNGVSSSFTINSSGALLSSQNNWTGQNNFPSIALKNTSDTTKRWVAEFIYIDSTNKGDVGDGASLIIFPEPLAQCCFGVPTDRVAYQGWVLSRKDSIPIATFSAGSGQPTDTAAFTTSSIYGSFYNSSASYIYVTGLQAVLQGTSPNMNIALYYGASLNSGGTLIDSLTCTNTTTGVNISGQSINIPPNVWIWCTSPTVTTKPTYMSITLMGNKFRIL